MEKRGKTQEYVDIYGNTVVHQRETVQREWEKQKELYDGWLVNLSPFKRLIVRLKRFLSKLKDNK